MKNTIGKIVFALLGISLLGYYRFGATRKVPELDLESNISSSAVKDTCATAERCLAVYITPWCGACRQSLPLINEIRSYCRGSEGRVGMKVILGLASETELSAYAQEVGGKVYFDPGGTFYHEMNAKGVPSWFVWDKERNLLVSTTGAVGGGSMESAVNHMIDKELKLGDFL